MKRSHLKIQTALAVIALLIGGTYANTAHAIFGVGDITLVDIQHDIIDELPVVIEQVVLTAVNDAANLALRTALAPRKISDHVNYALNLTNEIYVDHALVTSNDSNTALTQSLIAQVQRLPGGGAVNSGQIAQQRALTAFNPYSINPQIGNANVSIVDVLSPASSPNANISYQTEAMYGNATTVLGLAQQGANKDIAAGAGSKSTYGSPTPGQPVGSGGLSVTSAAKEVDTALDQVVATTFGTQTKPQDEFSAVLLALSKTVITVGNQILFSGASGTPIGTTPLQYGTTH